MARPYEDLINELKRYTRLVRKQKFLQNSGLLTNRDLDFVYEIAFLSAYTSFEVFLERQFEALLAGRPYYRNRAVGRRIVVNSERVARDVIRGTNRYPKYLPIENLEDLAKIFFTGGEPFTLLSEARKTSLRRGQIIRNYIAHRTRSTQQRFEQRVLVGITLRPSQRNPAGFLRRPVSNQQDRFEQMIAELASIAEIFVS